MNENICLCKGAGGEEDHQKAIRIKSAIFIRETENDPEGFSEQNRLQP